MKDPDEPVANVHIEVEDVAKHLLQAYPNVYYVALNPAITLANQDAWKDHWYFVGFETQPFYQFLDGYPAWVAREDIHLPDDEWGVFFMHVSSQNHYYEGIPIQQDPYDFASPRFFCWRKNPDHSVTQIYADELDFSESDGKTLVHGFDDLIQNVFMSRIKEVASSPRGQLFGPFESASDSRRRLFNK